jgi:Sec-independent protein translocase protein TatA
LENLRFKTVGDNVMFLGVSFSEAAVILAIMALLVLTTRFGLLKRTLDGFLDELRKGNRGTDKETVRETQGARDANDDICYQLLGITPSATPQEIREAYRKKAHQYHPDKGGDPDMMRALTEAYRRLLSRR